MAGGGKRVAVASHLCSVLDDVCRRCRVRAIDVCMWRKKNCYSEHESKVTCIQLASIYAVVAHIRLCLQKR